MAKSLALLEELIRKTKMLQEQNRSLSKELEELRKNAKDTSKKTPKKSDKETRPSLF